MLPERPDWWRRFFESTDSLQIAGFPVDWETDQEVSGLQRLLHLRPGHRILDVCCGPGRHLVRLARAGIRPIGLDVAALMLQLCRRDLGPRQTGYPLVRAEAQRLPFRDAQFDFILNLFNSFGYMEDDEENFLVLRETARCLRCGGTFFLETRNREQQLLLAPFTHTARLPGGGHAHMTVSFDAAIQRMNSRWYAGDESGPLIHYASIRLYTLDELREMFDAAGLRIQRVLGGYDGQPFRPHHRQLIILAQKL